MMTSITQGEKNLLFRARRLGGGFGGSFLGALFVALRCLGAFLVGLRQRSRKGNREFCKLGLQTNTTVRTTSHANAKTTLKI